MDALAVGTVTALGTVAGMLFWLLLVRPGALLGLFSEEPPGGFFEDDAGTLLLLRLSAGAVVVILGFVTGLTVAFLAGTR